MSINDDGPLSGSYANGIRDAIQEKYEDLVQLYIEGYTASGYLPFTKPLTPYGQLQLLRGWRGAGNPQFWSDPAAQAALARLEQRFGPSEPLAGPGLEPGGVPARSASVLGATLTSDRLGQPAGLVSPPSGSGPSSAIPPAGMNLLG